MVGAALFFPTCQVRVVRFYKSCPPLLRVIFAVIFASFNYVTERSGQRRISAGWAVPDLSRGASELGGQRRTSAARKKKRYVRKICQKECREKCQKRMWEDMPRDTSESMSKEIPKDMSEDMSKDLPERLSEEMPDTTSVPGARCTGAWRLT